VRLKYIPLDFFWEFGGRDRFNGLLTYYLRLCGL
jgi:hypothetical protein